MTSNVYKTVLIFKNVVTLAYIYYICIYFYISESIMMNRMLSTSVSEVEKEIKMWLRGSTDRQGGRKRREERRRSKALAAAQTQEEEGSNDDV